MAINDKRIVEQCGYAITTREKLLANGYTLKGLKRRVRNIAGRHIVYDPLDDGDGFLLVGDDLSALLAETVNHINT